MVSSLSSRLLFPTLGLWHKKNENKKKNTRWKPRDCVTPWQNGRTIACIHKHVRPVRDRGVVDRRHRGQECNEQEAQDG